MLVLSRKKDERIVIGNNVEIVVLAIQGNRVKLGFNAPNDVQIGRAEIYERIPPGKVSALPLAGSPSNVVALL